MSALVPVRVLIADDHEVVREGLASLFSLKAGFSVVGQARDGREALTLFRKHRPDIVLMDARMPVLDGLSAAKILRMEFPDSAIMILSAFDTSEAVYQAVRVGVRSYLRKDAPSSTMLQAARAVAAGEKYFSPEITDMLMQRLSQPQLTTREREILESLAAGKTNQEIANDLFIADGTVKAHVHSIYAKMGVVDRTQAVMAAVKRGLVSLN